MSDIGGYWLNTERFFAYGLQGQSQGVDRSRKRSGHRGQSGERQSHPMMSQLSLVLLCHCGLGCPRELGTGTDNGVAKERRYDTRPLGKKPKWTSIG